MTEENWSTVPVRGLRGWGLREGGVLTGLTHTLPWHPGVNECECALANGGYMVLNFGGTAVVQAEDPSVPHPIWDCSCGFYARYTTASDGYSRVPVRGMVEAWGDVVAGPKGFRASKAKIVALHLHKFPDEVEQKWSDGQLRTNGLVPKGDEAILREQYAGVPFFDSVDEMLEKFPIDQGEFPVEPEEEAVLRVARGGITFNKPTVTVTTQTIVVTCPTCMGRGRQGRLSPRRCPDCGGSGNMQMVMGTI